MRWGEIQLILLGKLYMRVNVFIQNPDGSLKIEGADYFYFFGVLMLVTAVLFTIVSRYYKPVSYFQEEEIATT